MLRIKMKLQAKSRTRTATPTGRVKTNKAKAVTVIIAEALHLEAGGAPAGTLTATTAIALAGTENRAVGRGAMALVIDGENTTQVTTGGETARVEAKVVENRATDMVIMVMARTATNGGVVRDRDGKDYNL